VKTAEGIRGRRDPPFVFPSLFGKAVSLIVHASKRTKRSLPFAPFRGPWAALRRMDLSPPGVPGCAQSSSRRPPALFQFARSEVKSSSATSMRLVILFSFLCWISPDYPSVPLTRGADDWPRELVRPASGGARNDSGPPPVKSQI